MSQQQIPILSINGYMHKYGVEQIGKENADRWHVKRAMLDEFRREIFNLSVNAIGPQVFSEDYEGTDKERTKLENILRNANQKWKGVCREFEKYKETSGLLKEEDLMNYLNDRLDLSKSMDEESNITTARMATEEEAREILNGNDISDNKEEESNGSDEGN